MNRGKREGGSEYRMEMERKGESVRVCVCVLARGQIQTKHTGAARTTFSPDA